MPADLRSINNFADLIAHLRDEFDWPVEDYLLDQLTFEYDADELGLKDEEAEKLKDGTIRQLRPLPGGQPFGIFFVEFGQSKLPVVVLRRIIGCWKALSKQDLTEDFSSDPDPMRRAVQFSGHSVRCGILRDPTLLVASPFFRRSSSLKNVS